MDFQEDNQIAYSVREIKKKEETAMTVTVEKMESVIAAQSTPISMYPVAHEIGKLVRQLFN